MRERVNSKMQDHPGLLKQNQSNHMGSSKEKYKQKYVKETRLEERDVISTGFKDGGEAINPCPQCGGSLETE